MKQTILTVLFFCAVSPATPLAGPPGGTGLPDPCESSAGSAAGAIFACPQGDGTTLNAAGLTITVTVRDGIGIPVAGVPGSDIWLIGCNNLLFLCGLGISAAGPTDANGVTTLEGAIATGGCDVGGVRVMVQGVAILDDTCSPMCLPIKVMSLDQKSTQGGPPDGVVTVADLALFGTSYQSPPKPYFECHDFVGGPYGTITLADYARLGLHFGHRC